MKTEAEILLEARKKLGLTQQEVADKASIGVIGVRLLQGNGVCSPIG